MVDVAGYLGKEMPVSPMATKSPALAPHRLNRRIVGFPLVSPTSKMSVLHFSVL